MGEPLLRVEGLRTVFPGAHGPAAVVDGVSLEVATGEVVALVGESGCGKSMTALSILRLVPAPGVIAAGRVILDGVDVLALPLREMGRIRGGRAAMIFQEPGTSLNPVLTVGAQVVEAIRLHEPVSRAAARDRTVDLFTQVGIPDPRERLDVYPHQLSGGLKQRVMIAIALAAHPRLLIADEPTTALDVTIQAQILELLDRLRRDLGMAVLLISHDFGVVNALADRVAVMYAGQIVEQGARADLLGAARHPYTTGLLRAMPARAARGVRLAEIPGVVPAPDARPGGCRFGNRCTAAYEPCQLRDPDWTALGQTHTVRCHAVAEGRA